MFRIAVIVALVIVASAALPRGASADGEVCQLAGINDGGGYIACGDYEGPALITGVNWEAGMSGKMITLDIVVNDESPITADVYFNPDRSVWAVLLYDEAGMFAYGMTSNGGVGGVSEASASYAETLDLYAPCTFGYDQGPHWCR